MNPKNSLCWWTAAAVAVAATVLLLLPQNTVAFDMRTRPRPFALHRVELRVVWDPRDVDSDSGLVDFPTSSQRTELKKEAKRRTARKQLKFYSFSQEETDGPWSPETFEQVWSLLTQHEMIMLKGVSRNDRKEVYQTALSFCEEMEELIAATSQSYEEDVEEQLSLPVALLSVEGHKALIYCPTLPVDHPDKFRLRTSVGQKNVWTMRPKPLRDNSGQVIKSRKEMVEMMMEEMAEE
jgi:hypothetical protein